MKALPNFIQNQLSRLRRHVILSLWVRDLILFQSLLLFLTAVYWVLSSDLPAFPFFVSIVLAGTLAATLTTWYRTPSWGRLVRFLDERFRLQQRVETALEVIQLESRDEVAELLLQDLYLQLQGIDAHDLHYVRPVRIRLLATCGLVVLSMAVLVRGLMLQPAAVKVPGGPGSFQQVPAGDATDDTSSLSRERESGNPRRFPAAGVTISPSRGTDSSVQPETRGPTAARPSSGDRKSTPSRGEPPTTSPTLSQTGRLKASRGAPSGGLSSAGDEYEKIQGHQRDAADQERSQDITATHPVLRKQSRPGPVDGFPAFLSQSGVAAAGTARRSGEELRASRETGVPAAGTDKLTREPREYRGEGYLSGESLPWQELPPGLQRYIRDYFIAIGGARKHGDDPATVPKIPGELQPPQK